MDVKGWNTFTAQDWYGFTALEWYGFRTSIYREAFHIYSPSADRMIFQGGTAIVHATPLATAIWTPENDSIIYVPSAVMNIFTPLGKGLLFTPKTPTEVSQAIKVHLSNKNAQKEIGAEIQNTISKENTYELQ